MKIIPRFIRFRDAPFYLGMDRNRFNAEVRPYIPQIPMGKQGVAFDRNDLDNWADNYLVLNQKQNPKMINKNAKKDEFEEVLYMIKNRGKK